MMEDLRAFVGKDEEIMYEGKPNKTCFILECIFNDMLPEAIIIALFQMIFIGVVIYFKISGPGLIIVLCFLTLFLMPVRTYWTGVLFSSRKYTISFIVISIIFVVVFVHLQPPFPEKGPRYCLSSTVLLQQTVAWRPPLTLQAPCRSGT